MLASLAALMAGALSASVAATPSLLTGVSFALSAVMLAVSLALAARVMMALQCAYLERAHHLDATDDGHEAFRNHP